MFLGILYLFISYFLKDTIKRKIGFVFALLASGLGGWAFLLNRNFFLNSPYFPVDLNVPEMNIFLILYQSPHFIASLGLMLLAILFMLIAWDKKKIEYSFFAGLILLFFFQFHPYYAPLLYFLFGVFSLWRVRPILRVTKQSILTEELKVFLPMFLISLPSVLYHAYLLNFDFPIFARAIQTETLTPVWWVVIMSFGLLFIFAVLGALLILKNKEKRLETKYQFLIFWFVIGFAFLYFPVSFQRRFIEGLSIPMIILSLVFIFNIIKIRQTKRLLFYYSAILLFLILFCFSNVVNYMQMIKVYKNKKFPFYFSENIISGMDWIKENLKKEDIILSFGDHGDFIPGFSGRRVYLGHWSETAFAKEKEEMVKKFFESNENDEARYQFLKNQKIDYIFYSEDEKELGEYSPKDKDYLRRVFENEEVKIYKVL
ncbi:MAG: hypothetical protein HQ538_06575 [Parcubacteria group bacterium]|nr:hypothetical protein [Parcubacteria group bacterium]